MHSFFCCFHFLNMLLMKKLSIKRLSVNFVCFRNRKTNMLRMNIKLMWLVCHLITTAKPSLNTVAYSSEWLKITCVSIKCLNDLSLYSAHSSCYINVVLSAYAVGCSVRKSAFNTFPRRHLIFDHYCLLSLRSTVHCDQMSSPKWSIGCVYIMMNAWEIIIILFIFHC